MPSSLIDPRSSKRRRAPTWRVLKDDGDLRDLQILNSKTRALNAEAADVLGYQTVK